MQLRQISRRSDPNCDPARPLGALAVQGVVALARVFQLIPALLGGIITRSLGFNLHGARWTDVSLPASLLNDGFQVRAACLPAHLEQASPLP